MSERKGAREYHLLTVLLSDKMATHMKHPVSFFPGCFAARVAAIALLSGLPVARGAEVGAGLQAATAPRQLNGETVSIFRVYPAEQCFEGIASTAYDPEIKEGESRVKAYWDDKTQFTRVSPVDNFGKISGPVLADFHYLSKPDVDAVKSGRPFSSKLVSIFSEARSATGFSRDDKHLTAMFTPNRQDKRNASGWVHFEGKDIPFSLSGRPSIKMISSATADILRSGYWRAKIFGNYAGERFIISRAELTEKPDPRQIDDPALPRVLVIGDSISMNYDASARNALRGKANYHRIEANGGSTGRGMSSVDLWLGPYWEKGFQWDVIQFNHGLHDLNQRGYEKDAVLGDFAVSIEDYKKNLEVEIQALTKTGAQLIWCTTTPVPADPEGKASRKPDADRIFNEAAMEVMSRHPEIIINDLNKVVRESAVFDEWRKGNNVHFKTPAELSALGQSVANAVLQALDKQNGSLKK